ncbi:MAG: ribbon-helix-helix protein, CopG family, partial [Pseudorhodobacter sp.]|nr:ribbon-helix-helix protein, CopG family [Frankiaceae bacterium]
MRTTVTLDEDVAAALQQLARERGLTFKEALNSSVRSGLAKEHGAPVPYRVPARS